MANHGKLLIRQPAWGWPVWGRKLWLCCAVLCVAGCASLPYEEGDSTAAGLRVAAKRIQDERGALAKMQAAILNLETNRVADLKPPFLTYDVALDQLYDAIERTERAVYRTERLCAEYMKRWDRNIAGMNYQVVRDRSLERKASVSKQLAAVFRQYQETREATLPMLAYLEDIRKALSTDLTSSGLLSLQAVMSNAGQNAQRIQSALVELNAKLAEAGIQMSSIAPGEGAPLRVEDEGQAGQAEARNLP